MWEEGPSYCPLSFAEEPFSVTVMLAIMKKLSSKLQAESLSSGEFNLFFLTHLIRKDL
jgi:hypothetical protein